MSTKPNTAVPAVKKEASTALAQLPEGVDFDADVRELGANYTSDQMAMPFLGILQALSPQVIRGQAEYIPEAKTGEFFNTVTKERYDGEKGINLIFGNFKESYIEWVPRNQGGGFVAEYPVLEGSRIKIEIDQDKNRVIQQGSPYGTPGNYLNLTHTRLGFVVSDDFERWTPVIISMASSQIKVSSQLNTRHKLLEYTHPQTGEIKKGPPLPYIIWRVKTKFTQNNNNQSWFAWDIELNKFISDIPNGKGWALYKELVNFAKSIQAVNAMQHAAEESVKQLGTKDVQEEIPF